MKSVLHEFYEEMFECAGETRGGRRCRRKKMVRAKAQPGVSLTEPNPPSSIHNRATRTYWVGCMPWMRGNQGSARSRRLGALQSTTKKRQSPRPREVPREHHEADLGRRFGIGTEILRFHRVGTRFSSSSLFARHLSVILFSWGILAHVSPILIPYFPAWD